MGSRGGDSRLENTRRRVFRRRRRIVEEIGGGGEKIGGRICLG